jgi:hypothetical protein
LQKGGYRAAAQRFFSQERTPVISSSPLAVQEGFQQVEHRHSDPFVQDEVHLRRVIHDPLPHGANDCGRDVKIDCHEIITSRKSSA